MTRTARTRATDDGEGDYRLAHQSAAHAGAYDPQFWAPRSARALDWDLEQRILDRIMVRELSTPPVTAVDFACGTGRVLRYLESRVPVTIGVDIADEMLALARPRCPESRLVRHDVTAGPHPDLPDSVDLITAFRFFLNADPDLRQDVLSWMRAVLAPDGVLIANFHLNPCSLRGGYLLLRWGGRPRNPMFSRRAAERLLDEAGFEVGACYGYEYLPYRREGRRPLFSRARPSVETRLLDRPRISGLGGAFVLVARPRCDR